MILGHGFQSATDASRRIAPCARIALKSTGLNLADSERPRPGNESRGQLTVDSGSFHTFILMVSYSAFGHFTVQSLPDKNTGKKLELK